MEFDPKDMDVVAWLAKLKSAEVRYPADLFASRRLGYTRKVAEIGLGLGISTEPKDMPRAASGGGAATTIGGVFETILMIAIVAEASAAAYFYRDQIADIIRSYSSQTLVTDVSPPPEEVSPLLDDFTSTKIHDITETPSPTMMSTATSLPTVVIKQNEEVENPQAVATSNPNGNNGNHYGQTPKPERTKEKGNNGGGDDDKGKGKDK